MQNPQEQKHNARLQNAGVLVIPRTTKSKIGGAFATMLLSCGASEEDMS